MPTKKGGDKFDLSTLGVEKVRFIKIKDVGTNFDSRAVNTEGFDFDAMKVLH